MDTTNLIRDLVDEELHSPYRRLVEEILDPDYYEKTVHPQIDHTSSTRINLSMSLYQILEVNERSQSIVVNVWMVQEWFDVSDTYLYNSEILEQKKTESLMNAIVDANHNSTKGASVMLMFPAIYKLSCRMLVKWFPYDQQNCSFIISSWTHDSSTIDYYPTREDVNLNNMAIDEEWDVVSFKFERVPTKFKCCEKPWIILYAHLVIKRKPLYYIINLVVPTAIITVVAVTGFFTPSSTSSERDEKLYLGINTLLTLSIMLLMINGKMPNTSTYVPLMGWYYICIIFVIVFGTFLATIVLFIHRKKLTSIPIPKTIRNVLLKRYLWWIVLEPPFQLVEIWTEFGFINEKRMSTSAMDPLLVKYLQEVSEDTRSSEFFEMISDHLKNNSVYDYQKRMDLITRQYTNLLIGTVIIDTMGKDYNGDRIRARPSNKELRAEAKALQQEMQSKAIEDASWHDDVTDKKLKKKAMAEAKRDLAEQKKRAAKMVDQLANTNQFPDYSNAKVTRHHLMIHHQRKEEERVEREEMLKRKRLRITLPSPVQENLNRKLDVDGDAWVGTTEDALEVFMGEDGLPILTEKEDRMSYKQFEEALLPSYKVAMPTFRVSQMRSLIKKEWLKCPENEENDYKLSWC
uniref:Neur_chan_LBD domain-containing protein n=1 Tax=Rhabditophanes sp. KR3021 TaxID=114890 RepID=A0AC35UAQ6_9BILA